MPYRDEHGHFISEEEARERGLVEAVDDSEAEEAPDEAAPRVWGAAQAPTEDVHIQTATGASIPVPAGSPFAETLDRVGNDLYHGYFRVFLNGQEILEEKDAPSVIEPGMRIVLTPYDKVGI